MNEISVQEAKGRLEQLLHAAFRGETVLIATQAGRKAVELTSGGAVDFAARNMGRRKRKIVQAPSPWLLHVFMSIPTAIAVAILVFSFSQLRKAHASETWPSVPGVIEEAGGRRGPPVYRYEVRGQTYRGWRTVFSSGGLRRFDEGDAVTVHVNPEDPRETVLYPGWTWRSLAMPAFGALVLLVATGMWRARARAL